MFSSIKYLDLNAKLAATQVKQFLYYDNNKNIQCSKWERDGQVVEYMAPDVPFVQTHSTE